VTGKGTTEAFLKDKDGKANEAKTIQKNRETTVESRSKNERTEEQAAASLTSKATRSRSATSLLESSANN
jgi:hypothetical protein